MGTHMRCSNLSDVSQGCASGSKYWQAASICRLGDGYGAARPWDRHCALQHHPFSMQHLSKVPLACRHRVVQPPWASSNHSRHR